MFFCNERYANGGVGELEYTLNVVCLTHCNAIQVRISKIISWLKTKIRLTRMTFNLLLSSGKNYILLTVHPTFSDLINANDVLLEKPLSSTLRALGFLNHLTLCNLSLLLTITHSSSSTSLFLTRNRVTWIYLAYIFNHRHLNISIEIRL